MNRMLPLLSTLVSIDTNSLTKEHYHTCVDLLTRVADERSLSHHVITGRDREGREVPNIVVSAGYGKKTLILATHYDVVPPGDGWKFDPFTLRIRGGRAYGRGACDDKGGIVACMEALEYVKDNTEWKVLLLITGDEEVGGEAGLGTVLSRGVRGDLALIVDAAPEPAIAASGIVLGQITVYGKQCHASMEYRGRNALTDAITLINALSSFKKAREKVTSSISAARDAPRKKLYGRFNITTFQSGEKENMIPGVATVGFDLRLVPEENVRSAIAELRRIISATAREHGIRYRFSARHTHPGYISPQENPFVRDMVRVIQRVTGDTEVRGTMGGNDGPFFIRHGIPVVCFGPIRSSCNAHGIHEHVYIRDLSRIVRVVKEFVAQGEESIHGNRRA